MPPEPLPFDRKDFFKERKPSSSEPVGIVPGRWREPPTTPSHQNNGSFSSHRLGGGGGSSDFRRPISGHGKQVGGGSHFTTVESVPREEKYCRNDGSKENNISGGRALVPLSCEKDRKEGNSGEATASPSGIPHPHSYSVNSWDQVQSKDQHDKNIDGGVSNTGGHRLEKENSLGSSIDWKPLKWIRSGSLSSRGSGFSHSSSSKSMGVDSLDTKVEAQPGNSPPLQSPSGDAAPCVTPRTLVDEASSRKKPRLGWGEGLAKYEKKKVGPDDIVNKEAGAQTGMVDGGSCSEPLIPSPANLLDKSPSLTGCSECASPATPYSFACSSSPGLEEKASIKAATVDSDVCNPSIPSCHPSQIQTEESTFNLDNLELTGVVNMSSPLNELLQSNDSSALGSGFVRSTAMDKLQVWKADITRTLEITESEIDSLENELKSLNSNVGGSCPVPAVSSSLPTECNKYTEERSTFSPTEKAVGFVEHNEVEDIDTESPGTATSKFVESLSNVAHSDALEPSDSPANLNVNDDVLGVVAACRDDSQVPAGTSLAAVYCREGNLHDLILASNRDLANRAAAEFSKLLPTTQWDGNILRATNESRIREKLAMRKCFLNFKERVITLKFRAFQYLWKEDLRLLSIRRFGAKSQKKFELGSRMGLTDYQKHRSSIRSRFSSPAGNLSLVPTAEVLDYAKRLLSDSRVRTYRKELKMPSLILDKRELMSSRFVSDNGLVENPVDVEKEKSFVNPWTAEEKEIFLEKFSLYGKDFRKIASFLQHKTIADCVEFYYKNHKSDRFQKAKKNSEFSKQGKSYSTNTYLVTSGKRWSRETNAASLDMLGAASAMAANVDSGREKQQKGTSKFYIGTTSNHKLTPGDGDIIERSNSLATLCNERETVAADVLAGICGSISSEALSSCITSLVDPGDVYHRCQKMGGSSKRQLAPLTPQASLNDDEETCSDDSCGGDIDASDWTDEERSSFLQAVASYGKDFSMISRCMRTRSRDQCKVFFSKARKCLELDSIHHEPGSEGTVGANQGDRSDHDHDGACMVDSGSVVSCDKSSLEFKMDADDLHSSDQNAANGSDAENKPEEETVIERALNGNPLEETANHVAIEVTETVYLEETPQNMHSASGADNIVKVSTEGSNESEHELPVGLDSNGTGLNSSPADDVNSASHYSRGSSLDLSMDHGTSLELNAVEQPCAVSQNHDDGFPTSSLFPQEPSPVPPPHRKTFSQDDISSRLSFRKSSDRSQRSSSTDGYHLHLPKRSLLDCVDSSQILKGYPVTVSTNKASLGYNEPKTNFKFDDNLLLEHCLPRDCPLQMCTRLSSDATSSQEPAEKPTRSGDVKLFGQILTNPSSQPPPKAANGSSGSQESDATHVENPNGRSSFSLKFDNHNHKHDFSVVDKNLPLRSYGFWDGSRIQTGFPSLPDSAMLLAKYPAAFGNGSTPSKLEQLHPSISGGGSCYRSQEVVPPFSVGKFLLSEMPRRKELEQQGRGMVAMACNTVSDPVAAIRMHYAKTEQLNNVGKKSDRL